MRQMDLSKSVSGKMLQGGGFMIAIYSSCLPYASSVCLIAIFHSNELPVFSFWNERSPQQTPDRKFLVTELGEMGNCYCLAFSPNGRFLFSKFNEAGSPKQYIARWNVADYKVEAKFEVAKLAQLSHIVVSPNGTNIAVGDVEGNVCVFSKEARVINSFQVFKNQRSPIETIVFCDDDNIICASTFATAQKWNIRNGHTDTYNLDSNGRFITAAAATPGATMFSWYESNRLHFASGCLEKACGEINTDSVTGFGKLALLENGRRAVISVKGGFLFLFDVDRKRLLKKWHSQSENIYCLLPLPTWKAFVTGDAEGNIRFWRESGEPLGHLRSRNVPLTNLAVAPDGTILASCGEQQRIVFWDLKLFLGKN